MVFSAGIIEDKKGSADSADIAINFMKPVTAKKGVFQWPQRHDVSVVKEQELLCFISFGPHPTNNRCSEFTFPGHILTKINDIFQDVMA